MSQEKLFAIGDIHGCADQLEELIAKLPLDSNSELVFLGDYIDRGPNSKKVIDILIDLKTKFKVTTLFGNHEAMFLEFINDPSSLLAGFFIFNGGSATLASYVVTEDNQYDIPKDHLQFFNELQLFYETEKFFFVHAGLPDKKIAKLDIEKHRTDFIWIRKQFLNSKFKWEKTIVHGHTPVREVEVHPNRVNLDTGCVFNGSLSAMELNSGAIYSVKAMNIPQTFLSAHPQYDRVAARFTGAVPVYVHEGERIIEFETINYNEFGMLILESANSEPGKLLQVGKVLKGHIGKDPSRQIQFTGQVVRHQKRDNQVAYGIKMIEPLKTPNKF